ncbi:hypothetical protein [Bradyrhizobium paxllaeri]|uniref:hypothetical protein n=1 Tax=Bradyrhizobium paxllaeri TaxID=190148 RepID=UPI001146A8ED|nr:hypothetical protein [Bradyrhizobium paxllaeri]
MDQVALLPPAGLNTGSSIRTAVSDDDLELDFNGAAALSDKSLNLAETETRTLAQPLRRQIGVERLPKHFLVMSACPWRDDFNYVVALHIDPLPFLIFYRFPLIDRGTASVGSTMLWRMTSQRRRRKSPLAMESINGRYRRSPHERDFGSLEVNAPFVSGKTIKPAACAFTDFPSRGASTLTSLSIPGDYGYDSFTRMVAGFSCSTHWLKRTRR